MKTMPWNEAAKQETHEGWVCCTCKKFYFGECAERTARYCCGRGRPCDECGKPTNVKHKTRCDTCQHDRDKKTYMNMQPVVWDGEQMLCAYQDDKYFSHPDAVLEWLIDEEMIPEDSNLTQEAAEKFQIILCEPHNPSQWEVCEEFQDYMPEEMSEPPGDWEKAEKAVNDWLSSCGDWCWMPGKNRLLVESSQ